MRSQIASSTSAASAASMPPWDPRGAAVALVRRIPSASPSMSGAEVGMGQAVAQRELGVEAVLVAAIALA